jgi:hypothetical protein
MTRPLVAAAALTTLAMTAASAAHAQPARLGSFDLAAVSGQLGARAAGSDGAAAWAAQLELGVIDLVGSARLFTAILARPGPDTGLRWRLGAPRLDVVFVCRDGAGGLAIAWPFGGLGAAGAACARPTWFGFGLAPFDAQIDARTGRALARAGAVRLHANPLANALPGDDAFLLRRLLLYAEGAVDWVVRRGDGAAPAASAARVAVGLDARLVSAGHRWEFALAGAAGTNPAAFAGERSIEARAHVALRFTIGQATLGRAGVSASVDHHRVPGRAIGTFASATRPDAAYAGIFIATTVL